jgi:hypothetical protein
MTFTSRKQNAKRRLDDLIHRIGQRLTYSHDAFFRLIKAVRSRSRLLVPCRQGGRDNAQQDLRIVRGCARMATEAVHWCRPPEDWTPSSASPFVQFRSLVSHLFDHFPVPNFMKSIWLADDLDHEENFWQIDLYRHLAKGRSIRLFPLPVAFRLTKRAAGQFMLAPDDFRPLQGIQWAWIKSLGGDDRFARLIISHTVLREPSEHGPFWESAIHFLIHNLPISAEEIVAVVRFVDEQKFQPAEAVWGPGAGSQPLEPNFSLQGRTLMSLRRQMANWREERLARSSTLLPKISSHWKPMPIRPFRFEDGERCWSIDEVLTERDLRIEGSILGHCVARYASLCANRRTSIWSMKADDGETRRRVLTIEVTPESKTIVQAKGKRNAPPTRRAADILRRWAEQEGLKNQ